MKIQIILILFLFLFSPMVFAQNKKGTIESKPQTLDEKIQNEIKDFKGKVWIYAKNLDTGIEFSLRSGLNCL